jgi:hypothetical protein
VAGHSGLGAVPPWDELPSWQQETDADIFEVIEESATNALPGR